MRAQSPNSNLPRQTRRRFGRNLASSPFSSFMFVTEPLPRIPVFQQRIKIPRPSPPAPEIPTPLTHASRLGAHHGRHVGLGFGAGLRSEMRESCPGGQRLLIINFRCRDAGR